MQKNIFSEKEVIHQIIDESTLSIEEKSVLKSMFDELKNIETERLGEIISEINANTAPSQIGKICLGLVSEKELDNAESDGFFPVYPEESFPKDFEESIKGPEGEEKSYGLGVYDGSYEDYVIFLNNNFDKVKPVLSDTEVALFKHWQILDGVQSPVLFGPWLRRVCRIYDRDLEDNHFLRGLVPVWNVKIEDGQKEFEGSVSPDGNEYNYQQVFSCPSGSFIVVDDDFADEIKYTIDYKEVAEKAVVLTDGRCNFEKVKLISVGTFDKNRIAKNGMDSFITIWKDFGSKLPCRLFSNGDIARVLSCISDENYRCELVKVADSVETALKRYEKKFKYPYNIRERDFEHLHRRKPFCQVKFTASDKWLTDYVEYVLAYLEYFYPEFRWVGVGK